MMQEWDEPERQRESELQLRDLAEIGWRRRWWLFAGTNVGLLIALVVFQQITPRYTASTTVLVDPQEISREYVHNVVAGDPVEELMRTIRERITSEAVLSKAIERIGPDRLRSQGVPGSTAPLAGLQVDRSLKQATVFEVSFTARDPELAADVVSEVTRTFVEDELAHRTRQPAATASFLAREVARLQRDLNEQELKIREIEVPGQVALPEGFIKRREAVVELNAELESARTLYTPQHPKIRVLENRLRQAELELERSGDEITLNALSPADASLLRDYDKLVARYHELDNRRLEASLARRVDEARQNERFRVLQPAYPPKTPSWPDWRLLGVGGLAGGLALGGLLAGLAEYRNPTFRTVDRLARKIALPILASIPDIKASDRRIFEWSLWQRLTRAWRRAPVNPLIVTHAAPRSTPAEQYGHVLAALTATPDARVVLVTSPGIGDGKSLTCVNLAAAATHDLHARVLLIDCDLRRPTVDRLLRLEDAPGVSEVVEAGGQLGPGTVTESGIPDLWVLPAGAPVRNPLRLLGSEEFRKVIDQARRDFDYVFIDSPPILPVADTKILNRISDLVVMVIRADKTPQGAIQRALRDLKNVAGIVFNDVLAKSYRRYYYDDAYRSYYKPKSQER